MIFEQFDQSSLSPELFKWCLNLVVENMEFRHSKSPALPWNRDKKISELKDPITNFLILFESDSRKPVAFASYQFTNEPDLNEVPIPCIYL